MVEMTGDVNFDALQDQADKLAALGNQQPGLIGLFNGFRARTPQLYVDIDREKVKTMGVKLTDVFEVLQAYLGSYYVNDFNRFGRTWQVNVQADAPFRTDAETVRQLKVRNVEGEMVPLGAVAEVLDSSGPTQVVRYNMLPAAAINGAALPGMSTGQIMGTMEQLANRELPQNMTYEWTDLSFLQKQESKLERLRDLQQNALQRLSDGVDAGVLCAGWALRELVAAASRDPGRADVPVELADWHRDSPHGHQHLRASRIRRAGRPGVQERHFDR